MFYSSLKRTLMVYMGILCFLGNPSERAFAATSLTVFLIEACQLLCEVNECCTVFDMPVEETVETSLEDCESLYDYDSNEIIVTFVGLGILIESTEGDDIITAVELYNANQQLTIAERLPIPVNSVTVDVSGLSNGFYTLKFYTINGVSSHQIAW